MTDTAAPTQRATAKYAYAVYDVAGTLQQKGATHPAQHPKAAAYAALTVLRPRPEEGWRVKVRQIGSGFMRTFVVNRTHAHGVTLQEVTHANT
jgi:hypothetical protein